SPLKIGHRPTITELLRERLDPRQHQNVRVLSKPPLRQILDPARGEDFPPREDGHPVAKLLRLLKVVGGQEQCLSLSSAELFRHEASEVLGRNWIQAPGRLI